MSNNYREKKQGKKRATTVTITIVLRSIKEAIEKGTILLQLVSFFSMYNIQSEKY